jgi:hypothetical protein
MKGPLPQIIAAALKVSDVSRSDPIAEIDVGFCLGGCYRKGCLKK